MTTSAMIARNKDTLDKITSFLTKNPLISVNSTNIRDKKETNQINNNLGGIAPTL